MNLIYVGSGGFGGVAGSGLATWLIAARMRAYRLDECVYQRIPSS